MSKPKAWGQTARGFKNKIMDFIPFEYKVVAKCYAYRYTYKKMSTAAAFLMLAKSLMVQDDLVYIWPTCNHAFATCSRSKWYLLAQCTYLLYINKVEATGFVCFYIKFQKLQIDNLTFRCWYCPEAVLIDFVISVIVFIWWFNNPRRLS